MHYLRRRYVGNMTFDGDPIDPFLQVILGLLLTQEATSNMAQVPGHIYSASDHI